MKRQACFASALLAALLVSGAANAQSFRAYLSVNGNDGNPCTVAAPCRLLPAALTAIASGGEVWMLDSANFNGGTVNITKSATILAIPGAVGSLVAFGSGPALAITGGVNVKLRNVVIVNNVTNPGTDGVQITGGSLDVADSQISAPGNGISAAGAAVRVHNTFFRDSDTAIQTTGASIVDVWKSRFTNMTTAGLWTHSDAASGTSSLTVSDSAFERVAYSVIANAENATAVMKAVVTRCTFADGSSAVSIQNVTGTGAKGTISGSTFSNHGTAIFNFGGAVVQSAGNDVAGTTVGTTASGTVTNIGTF